MSARKARRRAGRRGGPQRAHAHHRGEEILDVVLHPYDGGRHEGHLYAGIHGQYVRQRPYGTAVRQVADHTDLEVAQPPQLALDGVNVQQRLRLAGLGGEAGVRRDRVARRARRRREMKVRAMRSVVWRRCRSAMSRRIRGWVG